MQRLLVVRRSHVDLQRKEKGSGIVDTRREWGMQKPSQGWRVTCGYSILSARGIHEKQLTFWNQLV